MECYLDLCKSVSDKFSGKKITYIPHRAESEEKIILLQKRLGFDVFRPGKSAEVYLAEIGQHPGYVVSFASTVPFTISELFADICVWYVRVNKKMLLKPLSGDDTSAKYLEGMSNISILDIQ